MVISTGEKYDFYNGTQKKKYQTNKQTKKQNSARVLVSVATCKELGSHPSHPYTKRLNKLMFKDFI